MILWEKSLNTATLISIYFWDVKDIVLTLKRSETFETFIGIVKSNQEKIKAKIFFSQIFFHFQIFSKFHDFWKILKFQMQF